MTVPELRAAGIFAATAPYVAVIEDHCDVRPGWADRDRRGARGGSLRRRRADPQRRARGALRDWAAFFCEYSAFMEPVRRRVGRSLPGMNVSYDRQALAAIDDLLERAAGRPGSTRACASAASSSGATRVVLDHAKDFGFVEFVSQRYHYSRSYAGMRNAELGRKRFSTPSARRCSCRSRYTRIARNVRTSTRLPAARSGERRR